MKELIFATHNQNKVIEIRSSIKSHGIAVSTLADLNYNTEIIESADTLEGNALIKTRTIHEHFNQNVFSEDTGLEIKALNGAPGVYTARYAGPAKDAKENMSKVLSELKDADDRSARFKTVIALIWDNKTYCFEGICNGKIAHNLSGDGGFGYDPIFIPDGYTESFAQLTAATKNSISHRANAMAKLINFLKSV